MTDLLEVMNEKNIMVKPMSYKYVSGQRMVDKWIAAMQTVMV